MLVVYHRPRPGHWRSTYQSHLDCFSRFSGHDVFYLNTDDRHLSRSLMAAPHDAVIFHYTFLDLRQRPAEFARQCARLDPLRHLTCPKGLIPHDEQAHSDLLCSFGQEFGVTHVFTPAPASEWSRIYEGLDFDRVAFCSVLTGYVDDSLARRIAQRGGNLEGRRIDIGYRSAAGWPFYGRHGMLKGLVAQVVDDRAPEYELVTDISTAHTDAILGEAWFDFLLDCKYTIGVEGGSSVFDRDGTVIERTREYLEAHPNASFDEVEAACFPGMDGDFGYRLLGPRHFEAAMTRTCQILIEGDYQGVFQAGRHYIALRPDFSNLDEVLQSVQADQQRQEITSAVYRDVIESGNYSYKVLADTVYAAMLPRTAGMPLSGPRRPSIALLANRAEAVLWPFRSVSFAQAIRSAIRASANSTWHGILRTVRRLVSGLIGEDRLMRVLSRLRGKRMP